MSKTSDETIVVHSVTQKAEPQIILEENIGFLPIETNWFDRLFISVVIWVALSLFWFRFMEPLGGSIWISNAIALVLAIIIVRKG